MGIWYHIVDNANINQGMTLIEIYTGNIPFPEMETFEVGLQIANGQLIPADHLPNNVDKQILPILISCLNYTPENRPDFHTILKDMGNL